MSASPGTGSGAGTAMARTTAGTEMEQAWADAGDEFTEPRRAEIVLTNWVSSAGVAKFSMPQPEEEEGTGAQPKHARTSSSLHRCCIPFLSGYLRTAACA